VILYQSFALQFVNRLIYIVPVTHLKTTA